MIDKRKNRFLTITFLLNGFIFLLGGIVLIGDNIPAPGILQLVASILNFGMIIKFKKERIKAILESAVFFMNIVVSLSIAIDYMLSGKKYIQYAWIIAAILSSIALVIQIKKKRKIVLNRA